jgi:hypothetical protein
MPDLYGNQADSGWTWDVTSWSPGTTWGTRFRVTAVTSIDRVGFYRGGDASPGYSWLGLYNVAGTLLWSSSTPTDGGTNQWVWTTVSPPIELDTATDYTVAGYLVSVGGQARNGTLSSRAAPPAPYTFDAHGFYANTSGIAFPNTPGDSVFLGLAVGYGTSGGGGSGPGTGAPTLTGDNYAWLSADSAVNTHQTDGLPWLTKQEVDLIKSIVDLIKTGVDNVPKLSDPAWTNVLKLWQIAGALTDAEIAAWNLFAQRAPAQLTGASGGGGSAFFSGDGRQVANSAAEAVDWGARQWHRTETSNWLVPVPGTDWTLAATLDYTDPVAWDQPADAYVNTFTAWPVEVDQALVAGRQWLPRAAWWAPITSTLTHERRFADLTPQLLHALPMRCAGILLVPRPGYAGTLQAYLRPDPAV